MKKLALCLTALFGLSFGAQALTVTPATGGTNIPADTAANSPAPSWTTLGPINLLEKSNGHRSHFGTGTNITLVLKAPTGFEFNTAVTPSISYTLSRDITAASIAVSDNKTAVVTLTVRDISAQDSLVIGGTTGLQIRPTQTAPLATGHIYRPLGVAGGTAVIKGIVATSNLSGTGTGVTSFGQLVEISGVPSKLGVAVQPSSQAVVNTVFGRQPVVAVTDAFGNVKTNVNGVVVTAALNSGSGNLLGTLTANTVNGRATFTNLAATEASEITISFTASGFDPVVSAPVNVMPIPEPPVATALVLQTQPSLVNTAGVVFAQQPVVVVHDQYDVVFTDTTGLMVTAVSSSGSGDLKGTTTVQAVNGVATFAGLFQNVAEDITIEFSNGDLLPAISREISVVPAAANRLAFETQPGAATFGVPFGVQPVVVTHDAFGNFSITGLSASIPLGINLLSGTGTLSGTTALDIGTDEDYGVGAFTDLQIDMAGDKELVATAPGFISATSAVFTVSSDAQTIDFAELSDKTFGDAPFEVTATASSGLQVTFSVLSGPATISNNVVTIIGVGTVTIRASQAGDANYASAPDVDQSFEVNKANQTITFDALDDKMFGDASFTVSATASSELPVSFSIVSGPATIVDGTITLTGAGTVTVRASQAGNTNYNAAADVDQSFEVNKAGQTISFDALGDKTFGDAPFVVSATASSGLPVSFSIASGPATIDGDTVTITGAGDVTVRASQGGDDDFNAASNVDRTFTVAKATQTTTFAPLGGKTFGDAPFTVSATASSGLPVSFSIVSGPATIDGNTVTITGAGDVTVRASQGGNDDYSAASNVDRTFTVAKANQTTTFAPLGNKTFGDAPFTLSATASSGLPVSFSIVSGPATIAGNTVTITGAGTVTVRAAQGGNENYNFASNVDRSFTVEKANQTTTFAPLGNKTFGDAPFTLSATTSSGLPVSFSIVSGPATIAGNTVTITGAGTVTVRASQGGNDNYNSASNVDRSFTVAEANQTITFDVLSDKIYGDAPFTVSATASSGLPVSFSIVSGPATISGNSITLTGLGNVTVRASQGGDSNYNAAPNVDRTFAVNPTKKHVKADLNGDQKTDILFQNGGLIAIWFMDGVEFSSGNILRDGRAVPLDWRIFGQGDFTGDGKQDIAFQHTDGRLAIWEMDGAAWVKSSYLRNAIPAPPGWRAIAVSDFNNDDKADIVFQHADGKVAIWIMDNLDLESAHLIRTAEQAAGWRVCAAGDLDGDFRSDIIVQNRHDGRLAIWTGEELENTVALHNNNPITNGWSVIGAGDFNGLGQLDLLFQHTDGRLAVWLMDGAVRKQSVLLRNGLQIGDWKVVGPR